jgi:uncharacterized protein (DUF2236 family)
MTVRSADFERFAADGALVLGGAAAILLQVADPVVGRGVAEHSAFARDPVGRLRRTLGYVYAVSLGDAAGAHGAARRVDGAHRGVPGATDPDRQTWVAATLYWSALRVRRMLHDPPRPHLADEILERFGDLGTALQAPRDRWPVDRAAFDDYWRGAVARLEVGDDARRVAAQLLDPVGAPLWIRAAMPLVALVTAGLLPPEVRAAYRMPWSAARRRRFRFAAAVIRGVLVLTPRPLRELPARLLLPRH